MRLSWWFNCSGLQLLRLPPSNSPTYGPGCLWSPPSCRRTLCIGSSVPVPGAMVLQEPADGPSDATLTGSNKNKKPYVLVMCGKSSSDNEFAFSLKNKKSLKLAELEAEEEMLLIHVEPQLQSPNVQTFQTKLYMDNLSTCLFGRFLIWSPCLPSTHDLVSQNFRELPLGSVCVADIQIKGRGRSKNVWESPQGCLLFSFTLQMDNGRILPLVQYVVCLAVIEAIKSVCEMKALPCLDMKIKWPNDLYLGGLKMGGVLCTSSYRSKKFDVCAGVGINLDNEKPTTCLNAELKKLTYGIQSLTREEILSSFFLRFESLFEVFSSQGFEALEDLYYRYWMHSGQKVVIKEKCNNSCLEESVVSVQGLTSSGYLFAVDDDNRRYELHPDGNSFDFFKGLIRKKMES